MSEGALNWDRVVHKNVRFEDNQPVGNVVAVADDCMIVSSQGGRSEYSIPKSLVTRYDGAEVVLNLPMITLDGFKV